MHAPGRGKRRFAAWLYAAPVVHHGRARPRVLHPRSDFPPACLPHPPDFPPVRLSQSDSPGLCTTRWCAATWAPGPTARSLSAWALAWWTRPSSCTRPWEPHSCPGEAGRMLHMLGTRTVPARHHPATQSTLCGQQLRPLALVLALSLAPYTSRGRAMPPFPPPSPSLPPTAVPPGSTTSSRCAS